MSISNNKNIALFMGMVESGFNRSNLYDSSNKKEYKPEELNYHKSWDALMQVVTKIHGQKLASIEIHACSSSVSFNGGSKIFAGSFKRSLENTYLAVCYFIENKGS